MASRGTNLTTEYVQMLHAATPLRFAHIDADAENVVYTCDNNATIVHNLLTASSLQIPTTSHKQNITRVCAQADVVATTSLDGTCILRRFDTAKIQISKGLSLRRKSVSIAVSCALTAGSALLAVVFVAADRPFSWCSVYEQKGSKLLWSWSYPVPTADMSFSPDGRFVFLCIGSNGDDGTRIIVRNTATGEIIANLDLQRESDTALPRIASDLTADNVVIADGSSLRIWNIHRPEQLPSVLPSYTPDTASSSTGKSSIGPCAISRDGKTVVAAIAANCLALWDIPSWTRIASLVRHNAAPIACAISSCGNSIFSVGQDERACKWIVPKEVQENKRSVMENALMKILSKPDILDEEFILDYIKAVNVKSASDLLVGHNIILLAIRCGVITRDNVHTLGGSSWYLRDNLYLPASRLTDENSAMLDAVFHHAEDIGIISDGFIFKIAREINTDLNQRLRKVGEVLTVLSETVIQVERRVTVIEKDTSTLAHNVKMIHAMVGDLSVNQETLQTAVIGLSESLAHLKKSIEKGNKLQRNANIAKCVLSFIPLVGLAIGQAAYTATDIIMSMTAEDLVPFGVDTAKAALTRLAHVDLSNFQIASYLFSNKAMKLMEPMAYRAVMCSIRESGFSGAEEIGGMLQSEISRSSSESVPLALLDVGSSEWVAGTGSGKASRSTDGLDDSSIDERARKCFQYVTSYNPVAELSIGEATIEINNLLERCDGTAQVADERVEELFLNLAAEEAETVNEDVFVEIFRSLYEEQCSHNETDQMLEAFGERFEACSRPTGLLSIQMAAKLFRNLEKEMLEGGHLNSKRHQDLNAVVGVMRGFDDDGNGRIDRDEFLKAVQSLFHRSD